MKVGLFSPYLDTMGGGERYFLTAVEFFLKRGDQVDIFWKDSSIKSKIKERFNINIDSANFVDKFKTFGYDTIFFLSDGSLPLSFAKKTIIHFQVPFTNAPNNLLTKLKLINSVVVCNSNFTKVYIDKTFGIDSKVIYPPVDVENFRMGNKDNIILAVGRFFAPSHPKKQEVLIETFKKIYKKIPGWELVLIGGATLGTKVDDLIFKSKGYPIKIITDAPADTLRNYYSRSKLFWHAAGHGEDLETQPDRAEHFGISTVEAMAAGCVPLVFSGGGQREIITDTCGFLWSEVSQLEKETINLAKDNLLCQKISKEAIMRSKDFSREKFFGNLEKLI